jgi:CubicO group peptidase (beta-lactamase class C family)
MKRVALLLLALVATPLAAQNNTPLRRGETHSGTLRPGVRHTYTVELGDSSYVFGQANQISVDVRITILKPDGREEASFDGPNRGAEMFTFTSDTAGTWVIAVTAFEDQPLGREDRESVESGDYEIVLRKAEPVATNRSARIDQLMTPFTGEASPGAVIGVVDRGKFVFERAYGMADLSFGVPFRVSTPTNIGSVTKQFTAMSILLLQNDGLLSLDDEVRKHIPELPDFGKPVTLRNLLNHTGGFREIYNFLPLTGRAGEDHIDREEAIRIVQRQPELQATPDTEYNYNNTGYILLSMVVERLSGKTFPEFMKQRIFEPLGMNDTRVKYSQGEIIAGASTPYVPSDAGGWRSARDLAASAGAGGIYTTLHDMTKWMLNYRDATVGGREAIELLTTRNVLANGDTTAYALGIGVGERRGRTVLSHTGGDTAHRTFFSYFPELESGIFMSSNNASFTFAAAAEIEDHFFGDRLDPVVVDAAETVAASGTMSIERMEAIAGEWILSIPQLPVEILVEDGALIAHPQGQSRVTLTITSDSTATVPQLNVSLVFHFEGETVDSATFTQVQTTPMVRYDADELTEQEREKLVGRYYSRELELWLDIRAEDEGLVIHRLRGEPRKLTFRSDLTFTGPTPFGEVEFQRAANGEITGLVVGNGRTKGVLFVRQ